MKTVRPIKEVWIRQAWQEQAFPSKRLHTEGGLSLQVISPGIPARGEGPDFQGALLSFDQGPVVRGDVEVHVYTTDWLRHGHGRDPAYENVLLHVVYEHDTHWPCLCGPSGQLLPTLRLKPLLPASPSQLRSHLKNASNRHPAGVGFCPRQSERPKNPIVLSRLRTLGEERFQCKVNRFKLWHRWISGEELLYRAVFEALGYTQCRRPMLELAMGVPLASLRCLQGKEKTSRERTRQRLLRGAGLLQSVRGEQPVVSPSAWQVSQCRPLNHPRRRIQAMADLVASLGKRSWTDAFSEPFTALPPEPSARDIHAALRTLHRLWSEPIRSSEGPRLLGKGRSRTLVLNAILPALLAIHGKGRRVGRRVHRAAMLHPCLPSNAVTRLLRKTFLPEMRTPPSSYGIVQLGMIELMRNYCQAAQDRCPDCPLLKGSNDTT